MQSCGTRRCLSSISFDSIRVDERMHVDEETQVCSNSMGVHVCLSWPPGGGHSARGMNILIIAHPLQVCSHRRRLPLSLQIIRVSGRCRSSSKRQCVYITGVSHTCNASTERRAQASKRCRAARVRLGPTHSAEAVPLYGAASHIAGALPAAVAASNACRGQVIALGVDDGMCTQ